MQWHTIVAYRRRRGVASALAMLFVVLFSLLALGFYSGVTTSVQLSGNERRQAEANFAAESGLQFISYQLANLTPVPSSDMGVVFNSMLTQLATNLNYTTSNGNNNLVDAAGTAHNLSTATVNTDGSQTFFIPARSTVNNITLTNWMRLGANAGSCVLVVKLDAAKTTITVAAVGQSTGASPAMRALQYNIKATSSTVTAPWAAPNGSIVTYSALSASNGVTISGNVMALPPTSQTPATVTGGARITGTLSYPSSYPNPVVNNGGSINATSKITTLPPAPTFDTSAFATLVPASTQAALTTTKTSTAYGGVVLSSSTPLNSSDTYTNVRIKANSNLTFGNNTTFNGVVYIESPNKITFSGGVVNGVIVSDNSTSAPYNPTTPNNIVTINNGAALKGTSSITTIPTTETAHITTLKNMFVDSSGNPVNSSMIMTPNFGLNFQGGMTVAGAGAIVGSQFTIANGSAISLSGVLLNIGNSAFTVAGGMTINKSGLPTAWPGIMSGSSTATTVGINRGTYAEVNANTWLQ